MHYRNRVLGALIVSLFAYSVAYGCDCRTLNSKESFQQSESVFYGTVVSIERSGIKQKVVFEGTRTLKGIPADKITLHQGQTDCDFAFVPGSSYLVYANASSEGLVASSCSSTRVFAQRSCGTVSRREKLGVFYAFYPEMTIPFTLGEIAFVTAVCVSLSLSIGIFFARFSRRRQ